MTRRPARPDSKKLDGNTTALQGAALAFAAQGKKNNINGKSEDISGHRTDNPASIPPAISKADGARRAALFANTASYQPIDNAQDSGESMSSSISGTVRNRIELFSGSDIPDPKVSQAGAARDTQNRDGKPNVRTDPQHIAAQLAVDRSKTPVSSTQIASSKAARTMGRLESNTTGPNNQDINRSSSTSIYVRTGQRNDTPADQRPTPPKSRARISSDLPPEKKEASMVTESRLLQRKAAAKVASHGGAPSPDTASLQPLSRPPIPPKPPLSPSTTQNAVMAAKRSPPPPPPPRPATVTRPSSLGDSELTTPETPRSRQLAAQPSCSSLRPQHSGMSESSRLDAIMASSIATSRSPSPAKRNTPPPPPPHRRSRSRSRLHLHPTHNILDRSTNSGARNVSPAKSTASTATSGTLTPATSSTTMRRTMRPQKTGDEFDNHQGHHHRLKIRSHPHKHREGDRKRWRDQISERERKRYEGVWAANKGLWITADEQVNLLNKSLKLEDMVISMVVRDIWSRSRLPRTLLEQIWNLVSGDGRALLSKEEFVVGMWLIDQSLKGRKLPAKVSQSVWDSVTVGGNWRITTSATANTAPGNNDARDTHERFC